ncbi:MAG TPA: 50S ribosomal protein L23 [Thermoflexia bacterium]|nr:50S ribosomal protein L23 [Thermoflexia bacterium]
MNVYDVIIAPVFTEKSEAMKWDGKYTFEVHTKANKNEIKRAVEVIYNVKVASVNTMIMPAKFSGSAGRRRGVRTKVWKKAIVSLVSGQRIVALEA